LLSGLEKFIAKRVIILLAVLIILDLAFLKDKLFALAGLCAGGAIGLLKFGFMGRMFSGILSTNKGLSAGKRYLLWYIGSLIGLIAALAASAVINLRLFGGITAGVLAVPFVIFVNSLTDGMGITHNNFE